MRNITSFCRKLGHFLAPFAATAILSGCAQASPTNTGKPLPGLEAQAPGVYRELREIKGHFSGGQWNEDVDKWQGKKHQVMQVLGAKVASERLDATHTRELMGAPDRTHQPGDQHFDTVIRMTEWKGKPQGSLWVYDWRGAHDQLVFAFDGDKLTASGWLYSWE
ncbi:hypothetical protein O5O45_03410 [Hahella aquimaris]|uniref:hypothetical protein n=1 Tax=Hahella sp. HNIBRBA332 TaxID=3015983 RepID=UPI00273AD641|nr:hypothetical protein [Hahella sp. HNIBRBA332]WLQ14977.1 hypothetical protein O5O45_03410 [Hahella sp. HNIBRBA332]